MEVTTRDQSQTMQFLRNNPIQQNIVVRYDNWCTIEISIVTNVWFTDPLCGKGRKEKSRFRKDSTATLIAGFSFKNTMKVSLSSKDRTSLKDRTLAGKFHTWTGLKPR